MNGDIRATQGAWCFYSQAPTTRAVVAAQSILADDQACALARLIPVLGCGEEAAALAFDGLAQESELDEAASLALRLIATEERGHEHSMRRLAAALPPVSDQAALLRATRKLHICLGSGGYALHLARIAALDAAVCTILSRLLRVGAPLSRDQNVHRVLSQIRSDEARHVSLSRTLVIASGKLGAARDVGASARQALAHILMQEGGAFEALGVDPGELEQDISRLPDGLFAA